MAKIQIKSERFPPFSGIFSIIKQFDILFLLSNVIDSILGKRCQLFDYSYNEIIVSISTIPYC